MNIVKKEAFAALEAILEKIPSDTGLTTEEYLLETATKIIENFPTDGNHDLIKLRDDVCNLMTEFGVYYGDAQHLESNPNQIKFGEDSVEWFDGKDHVFDLTGIDATDRSILEKLHELYERSDEKKRAEIRGALRLVEDGLTCGYISEIAPALSRACEINS